MTDAQRFLIVRVEADLAAHDTTWDVLFDTIRRLPGVHSVCDLSAISTETLTELLLAPQPELVESVAASEVGGTYTQRHHIVRPARWCDSSAGLAPKE